MPALAPSRRTATLHPDLDRPVGWLATRVARAVVALLCALPRGGREALASALAAVAYGLGIRRRVTLENLRLALPELPDAEHRRIARGAYRSMALTVLEALASPRIVNEPLGQLVLPDNWETFASAVRSGQGVLMATAHLSNWELVPGILCRSGIPFEVLVRPLNGALNRALVDARLDHGANLLSPKGAVGQMAAALARGSVVMVLVDQVIAAKHGVFVDFFGRPASTAPAVALAAQRTGAPVFVVVAVRKEGRFHLFVEGPIPAPKSGDLRADIVSHTAAVTAALERYIRRFPDQWLWLHRRWKVQPTEGVATGAGLSEPGSAASGGPRSNAG